MRSAKGNCGEEQDAAPCPNVENPGPVAGERFEVSGGAPPLKAAQCKPCRWMEPGAKCLAGVDRDDRVIWGGGVFAPRGANNNATDAQDGELGAPTGCPLLGGDRSYQQRPNAAQSNPAA